jgi:mannose-1-phosphate guanylyltransferase
MKILLLSGGAGRRLWPLSNQIRAKQFLKLLSREDNIQNQVASPLPIISEPSQKGTFSAVSLAVAYLHSKQETGLDEKICVLPVDVFADLSLFHLINKMPSILAKSLGELAHIGVEPEFPSDQLGYIVPGIIEQFSIRRIFIPPVFVRKEQKLLRNDISWIPA